MSIDLKFVELTADVLELFVIKYVYRLLVYICVFVIQQDNVTPPITIKLIPIVYYKYQQRSLQ